MGPLNSDKDGMEIIDSKPLDTYLTGILWPVSKNSTDTVLDKSEQENMPAREDRGKSDSEEGEADEGVPLHSIIRPSSIGLTFHLPKDTPFQIEVSGACYDIYGADKANRENLKNSDEDSQWVRIPFHYRIESKDLNSDEHSSLTAFKDSKGQKTEPGFLEVRLRKRIIDDLLVVTATVINRFIPGEDKNTRSLYQVHLSASVNGEGYFCSRKQSFKSSDEDSATNSLIYRHAREYAVGHGIAAGWEPRDPEQKVSKVFTSWIPEW